MILNVSKVYKVTEGMSFESQTLGDVHPHYNYILKTQ